MTEPTKKPAPPTRKADTKPAAPVKKATAAGTTAKAPAKEKAPKKYKVITANFFRGKVKGQVNSVYKAFKDGKLEKLEDYKLALKDNEATLGTDVLTASQVSKLDEMGIDIPEAIKPAPKPVKEETPVAETTEAAETTETTETTEAETPAE